jgi:hypothetical protein
MITEYEKLSGESLDRGIIEAYTVLRELRWLRRYKENGDDISYQKIKAKLLDRVPGLKT